MDRNDGRFSHPFSSAKVRIVEHEIAVDSVGELKPSTKLDT